MAPSTLASNHQGKTPDTGPTPGGGGGTKSSGCASATPPPQTLKIRRPPPRGGNGSSDELAASRPALGGPGQKKLMARKIPSTGILDPWPGSTCRRAAGSFTLAFYKRDHGWSDVIRRSSETRYSETPYPTPMGDPRCWGRHGRSGGREAADLLIERYENGVINTL